MVSALLWTIAVILMLWVFIGAVIVGYRIFYGGPPDPPF